MLYSAGIVSWYVHYVPILASVFQNTHTREPCVSIDTHVPMMLKPVVLSACGLPMDSTTPADSWQARENRLLCRKACKRAHCAAETSEDRERRLRLWQEWY